MLCTNILLISEDNLVAPQVSRPLYVDHDLRVDNRGDVGRVTVPSVATLLGDILTNSDWNLLVLGSAVLARDVLALLERLIGADIVRNLPTLLDGDLLADL